MKIHFKRLIVPKDFGNHATANESFYNKANKQKNLEITLLHVSTSPYKIAQLFCSAAKHAVVAFKKNWNGDYNTALYLKKTPT